MCIKDHIYCLWILIAILRGLSHILKNTNSDVRDEWPSWWEPSHSPSWSASGPTVWSSWQGGSLKRRKISFRRWWPWCTWTVSSTRCCTSSSTSRSGRLWLSSSLARTKKRGKTISQLNLALNLTTYVRWYEFDPIEQNKKWKLFHILWLFMFSQLGMNNSSPH